MDEGRESELKANKSEGLANGEAGASSVAEIDNPIIENETMVYADKKKGLPWLSSAKSNSQAIAAETLNTAAKIVKEFENPSLPKPQKVCRHRV